MGPSHGAGLPKSTFLQALLSLAAGLGRHATGRHTRRAGFVLLLAVFALSSGIRIRTSLLTRRIQAVLAGLQQIELDITREEELRLLVPYLIRQGAFERREGIQVLRFYEVEISNDYRWHEWVPQFVIELWPPKGLGDFILDKWNAMDGPLKAAYILGWRYLSFSAYVTVTDGTVSKIAYHIEPDVFAGWPKSYLVAAQSTHGLWMNHHAPVPVSSADDESPYYRFGPVAGEFSWFDGKDATIGVAYTPDAPRESVAHIFQVDLSCFWSLRGCHSMRQVAPLLWKDRAQLPAATAERLFAGDPCPDRVLAGRVRTLPDLNVALLEVAGTREVDVNTEGEHSSETFVDYKLIEIILGHPQGPWSGVRVRRFIPSPLWPREDVENPLFRRLVRVGERFLYFSGAEFASCRMVPATPSAQAAVRGTSPARGRRVEDEVALGGRM